MTEDLTVRDSEPGDLAAIEALYPDAFPEEDLVPLVRELMRQPDAVLSLVGIIGGSLVGHIVFTMCGIDDRDDGAVLLGPLAVAPTRQRRGIGGTLVQGGLERLERSGVAHVYVLGDPAYYGRFGFRSETQVMPPYPLPAEWRGAWQAISLGGAAPPGAPPDPGTLTVPSPWRRPALWAP